MTQPFDEQEASRRREAAGEPARDGVLRSYTAELYAACSWLSDGGVFVGSVKVEVAGPLGRERQLWVTRVCGDSHPPDEGLRRYDQALLERARRAPLDDQAAARLLQRSRLDRSRLGEGEAAVDGWLHAWAPKRWLDFVHPGGALACLLGDDVSSLCMSLKDGALGVVAFHQAPRAQAEAVAEALDDDGIDALLIARRGVLVCADDPQHGYRRMTELLATLDALLSRHVELPSITDHRSEELVDARRRVALSLRGALMRVGNAPRVAAWKHDPELQVILRHPEVLQLAQREWLYDHPATQRDEPLILNELSGLNAEALAQDLDNTLRQQKRRVSLANDVGANITNVALIPDLGLVALGRHIGEARQRATAWAHLLRAVSRATALGGYQAPRCAPAHAPEAQLTPPPLSGRVALVTGVGSGIGSATAKALLAAGAHVVLCARDERVLGAVGEWPTSHYGAKVLLQLCDPRSALDCARAVERACDTFGGLDILVSTAGVTTSGAIFSDNGHQALTQSLEGNLLAHQQIARHVATAMLQQRSGGVLLFNAAKSAFHQGPGFGPYAVAKAALVSLMRQYAIDLGREGIRANAINADLVRTNLIGDGIMKDVHTARDLSPLSIFAPTYCSAKPPRNSSQKPLYFWPAQTPPPAAYSLSTAVIRRHFRADRARLTTARTHADGANG